MWNKNTETILGCDSEYAEAGIVIFGAPFDSTTSFRPGTRFACKAMRSESFGLETYSPYQNKDLSDCAVFDGGDIELPFGNAAKTLDMLETATAGILADGKLPVMIGGEHLVTLGALRACAKKYPNLHVIHFDAHADLRENYLGEALSHATVMHRVWDIVGDAKIYQYGIRSGTKYEFEFADKHTYMNKFNLDTLDDAITELRGKPVYFSLDLDVLDPSIFPGTGTPEAGGIGFAQLLDAVIRMKDFDVIGCDITELSPVYDQSGTSTAVACKLLREVLIMLGGK